jgi:preprotein translocase subunit SecF
MNLRRAVATFRGHEIPHFNFTARRNLWFAISGAFILLSLVGLIARGLNFSIEFTGGSLLEFQNASDASVKDYQSIMATYGLPDAEVEILGAGTVQIKSKSLTDLDVTHAPSPSPTVTASASASASASAPPGATPTPSASASESPSPSPSTTPSATPTPTAAATASPSPGATATTSAGTTATPSPVPTGSNGLPILKGDQLRAALAKEAGISVNQINEQDVGPTWGSTISRKMLTGLIVFLVLVSLYITLRFEYKMAAGALTALLHDLIITAGIYALVGREVTPETVIAILTILGYSLYDTVVIYDKIKENTESAAAIARDTYAGVVNTSLNQTLMRSVNTSLVVLLPIGALLLFGGSTLKDFAFALFVGVASGTYSSIFVAAPLLSILKEREPRYQQIRARAEARAARPGLRAVPSTKSLPKGADEADLEAAAGPARVATLQTERTRTPSTGSRARAGSGSGGAKKKKKPQGKSKPRRR